MCIRDRLLAGLDPLAFHHFQAGAEGDAVNLFFAFVGGYLDLPAALHLRDVDRALDLGNDGLALSLIHI